MKYITILSLLVLISCELQNTVEPYSFNYDIAFADENTAHYWVVYMIDYVEDQGDDWQLPEETMDRGAGDCEDKAILLMCFLWDMGHNPELIVTYIDNVFHAMVLCDGVYYDSTSVATWSDLPYATIEKYSYGEALYIAER